MRHLRKIYESQYDNTLLEDSDFDSYRRQSIPFGKRDIDQIFDYFDQWPMDSIYYYNQNPVGPGHKPDKAVFSNEKFPMVRIENLSDMSGRGHTKIGTRCITIFKLPDEYYLVFDWTSYYYVGRVKCDEIGGLMEYFDGVLKKYPKLGEDFRTRRKLKLSIQSMMSGIDEWPMDRIKSLDDFLKSSES
jgi:hypothetical protein